ncbi:NIPSNAP family protein [Roseobacter sp.]|uniref:NIPSNAP family protein n=1 Tax=Roseobacter sp. TaxID=1907202 RepID=UPI0032988A26
MITCFLKYEIDPAKVAEFEIYAKAWIHNVNRLGGTHHGYWLPSEGANDVAWCGFSFASLAAYEDYRKVMETDPACIAAYKHAERTQCIRRYERSFTRPVLDGVSPADLGLMPS